MPGTCQHLEKPWNKGVRCANREQDTDAEEKRLDSVLQYKGTENPAPSCDEKKVRSWSDLVREDPAEARARSWGRATEFASIPRVVWEFSA